MNSILESLKAWLYILFGWGRPLQLPAKGTWRKTEANKPFSFCNHDLDENGYCSGCQKTFRRIK